MSEQRGDERPGEVIPGIMHWSGPHPKHGAIVHSYFLAEPRAAIDPLSPPGVEAALEDLGGVDQVILSCRHHLRGGDRIIDRFGATLRCPRPGLHEFEQPGSPEAVGYDWGEEVASGVIAHEVGSLSPDDGALHVQTGSGALVLADSVVRDEHGLGFVPDAFMDDPEATKAGLLASLRKLLELDFDALLLTHGEPLPEGGKEALASFADSPRSASLG